MIWRSDETAGIFRIEEMGWGFMQTKSSRNLFWSVGSDIAYTTGFFVL